MANASLDVHLMRPTVQRAQRVAGDCLMDGRWESLTLASRTSLLATERMGKADRCGLHISALRWALLDEDGAHSTPNLVQCNKSVVTQSSPTDLLTTAVVTD